MCVILLFAFNDCGLKNTYEKNINYNVAINLF